METAAKHTVRTLPQLCRSFLPLSFFHVSLYCCRIAINNIKSPTDVQKTICKLPLSMAVTVKTISGNKCSGKWWVPPSLGFRSLRPVWGKRRQVLKDRWRLAAVKRDGKTPSAVVPKASEFRCLGVPTRALEFCWEISNLSLQIPLFWIPGWTASSHAEPLLLIVWHTGQTSRELLLGWFGRLPGSRAISSRKLVLNAHQAFAEDANFGEHLRLQSFTTKPH